MTSGETGPDIRGPENPEDVLLGTGPLFSARVLIQQLLRRRQATRGSGRLRQHERYECCIKITVQIEQPGPQGNRVQEVPGVLQDVSAGGLSFLCDSQVPAGTVIRVRFDTFGDQGVLPGIVRRCRYVPGEPFLVAVEFQ